MTSTQTTALETIGLSAGYRGVPVLDGIDLFVNPGEVVALMGANGSGKTTAMKCIAGLLEPIDGEVWLFGSPSRHSLHANTRAGLRYVSEERSVIRGLSTLDNLRLGPGPVEDAVELFPELKPLLRRPAGLLSGGEQQILALARAMAGDPKLLLADELSLGLAPLVVERLLAAAVEAARRGVAVLIVEQHVRAALSVADRGYVMRRGSVHLSGSSDQLRSQSEAIESLYLAR